ncbi:MAG TPA: hypothetical protein VG843_13110 [Rhizomicrobium sp.]|jgi:hypothetical protein|nr:hypothetical protein [Rhizomicrobium sp.]
MSESASFKESQAEDAVRAYIRMNRARLAADPTFLALLSPDRFGEGDVRDLQRFVIERLRAENASLRAKLEAVERAVKSWGNPQKR